MQKCPCEDCLLLPLCKIQATEYIKIKQVTFYKNVNIKICFGFNIYEHVLKHNCNWIKRWIDKAPMSIRLRFLPTRFTIIYDIFVLNKH